MCLTRVHKLNAILSEAFNSFRADAFKHIKYLNNPKSVQTLGEIIGNDLRLWEGV